jgi:hypothetical protein
MTPTLTNKSRGCEASAVVNTIKLQGTVNLDITTSKLRTAQFSIFVNTPTDEQPENYVYAGAYNANGGSNLNLNAGYESYQIEVLQDCLDLIAAVETDGLN